MLNRHKLSLAGFFIFFMLLQSCIKISEITGDGAVEKEVTFLFLYTNDEHGHFYEKEGFYKAAVLYEMWHEEEENCKGCKVFRISGGDNYTGFAGSSMFNGNSMAEIMNIIGYQISAVGNHEFDFGIQPLQRNMMLSGINYISSNVVFSDRKRMFRPYVIMESLDGDVAFIGSTTEDLKQVSFANYILDAKVVKPAGPVGRKLKKLRNSADIKVIVAHDGYRSVVEWVSSLDVKPLIVFNAHSHEQVASNHNDVLYIQAGRNLNYYARVEVVKKGKRIRVTKADIIPLKKEASFELEGSKKIKGLTDKYLAVVERKAGKQLVLAEEDFDFASFQRLYACSMLDSYPDYDVSMSNPGGFRDSIRKGVVKRSDIISMLPFNNRIVLTKVKGKDLLHNIKLSEESYCGAQKKDDGWYIKENLVDTQSTYSVVVHEYIFGGGDFFKFPDDRSESEITSSDWRAPVEKCLADMSKNGMNIQQAYESLMEKYGR